MKGYPQKELYFDNKELKTDLGQDNKIFVGSSCDDWASDIPTDWISQILKYCRQYDNTYLFQTKNPARFVMWRTDLFPFPDKTMLGVTIETDREYCVSKAPSPLQRMEAMAQVYLPKMVSIEPIMDFDLPMLVHWIKRIKPDFVSIGADSKGHNLPEPPPDKVKALIEKLQGITEVKIKDNLKRLL
jgi:DNA repair photolyase